MSLQPLLTWCCLRLESRFPCKPLSRGLSKPRLAALTSIVTVIPGWETITNLNAAVLGVARDADQVYREQYKLRTAQRSIGPSPALESAQAEAGAARSKVTENNTDLAIIVQQWTIFPHAILVMVEGGSDNDVRRAVENHRGMGAGTGAAVIGGTPSTLNTLQGITNGTLTWDGEDYTGRQSCWGGRLWRGGHLESTR